MPLLPRRGERDHASGLSRNECQGSHSLHDTGTLPSLHEDDHQQRHRGGGLQPRLCPKRARAFSGARMRRRLAPVPRLEHGDRYLFPIKESEESEESGIKDVEDLDWINFLLAQACSRFIPWIPRIPWILGFPANLISNTRTKKL